MDFVYTPDGKNFCFAHFTRDISPRILHALKHAQKELQAANGRILMGVNTSNGLDRTKRDKIVQVFFTSKGTFYRTDNSLHVWNAPLQDWVRTETDSIPAEEVEMEDDLLTPPTKAAEIPQAPHKLTQQELAQDICRALFV